MYRLLFPVGAELPRHGGGGPGEGGRCFGEAEGEPAPLAFEVAGGDLGADMARWGALGKSAVRVLREAGRGPKSAAAIAGALGVSVTTVRAHLRKLEAHGLVRAVDGIWHVVSFVAAQVAERCGTAGKREQERARYAEIRRRRKEAWWAWRQVRARTRASDARERARVLTRA